MAFRRILSQANCFWKLANYSDHNIQITEKDNLEYIYYLDFEYHHDDHDCFKCQGSKSSLSKDEVKAYLTYSDEDDESMTKTSISVPDDFFEKAFYNSGNEYRNNLSLWTICNNDPICTECEKCKKKEDFGKTLYITAALTDNEKKRLRVKNTINLDLYDLRYNGKTVHISVEVPKRKKTDMKDFFQNQQYGRNEITIRLFLVMYASYVLGKNLYFLSEATGIPRETINSLLDREREKLKISYYTQSGVLLKESPVISYIKRSRVTIGTEDFYIIQRSLNQTGVFVSGVIPCADWDVIADSLKDLSDCYINEQLLYESHFWGLEELIAKKKLKEYEVRNYIENVLAYLSSNKKIDIKSFLLWCSPLLIDHVLNLVYEKINAPRKTKNNEPSNSPLPVQNKIIITMPDQKELMKAAIYKPGAIYVTKEKITPYEFSDDFQKKITQYNTFTEDTDEIVSRIMFLNDQVIKDPLPISKTERMLDSSEIVSSYFKSARSDYLECIGNKPNTLAVQTNDQFDDLLRFIHSLCSQYFNDQPDRKTLKKLNEIIEKMVSQMVSKNNCQLLDQITAKIKETEKWSDFSLFLDKL